jgi:hypothetical protein
LNPDHVLSFLECTAVFYISTAVFHRCGLKSTLSKFDMTKSTDEITNFFYNSKTKNGGANVGSVGHPNLLSDVLHRRHPSQNLQKAKADRGSKESLAGKF